MNKDLHGLDFLNRKKTLYFKRYASLKFAILAIITAKFSLFEMGKKTFKVDNRVVGKIRSNLQRLGTVVGVQRGSKQKKSSYKVG